MTQGQQTSPAKIEKIKTMSKDFTNYHIAKKLDLNPKTVKKYTEKE